MKLVNLLIIFLFLLLLIHVQKSYASERSYCQWQGNTQVCINYHRDDQTGESQASTSIQYNASNPNSNRNTGFVPYPFSTN